MNIQKRVYNKIFDEIQGPLHCEVDLETEIYSFREIEDDLLYILRDLF